MESTIWQGLAPVLINRDLGHGYYLLQFHAPEVASAALPGQMLNLRVTDGWAPLLRRPMSIGRVDRASGLVDIWYKVVGAGTGLMARLRPGDSIDLLGPAGRPFTVRPETRRLAVIGRGVGNAPLVFLGEWARERGIAVWAFLSGRNQTACFGADALSAAGAHVLVGTDCGAGLSSDALLGEFTRICHAEGFEQVATCGSRRMAKLVDRLAKETGLVGEVSLEAQMGCAMGACKGCVCSVYDTDVPEGRRYALVCQEGPVFPVGKVVGYEA